MKKVLRLTGKVVLIFIGLLLAYALVGTVTSLIPANGTVSPGHDVVVYLGNNGVHTDIIVPTRTECFDWSTVVHPSNTSAKVEREYLAFGWGSQDFYLNVPEWKDLTIGIALKAISGTGGTVLHTAYLREPVLNSECRRLTLTRSQYDALVQYVLSSGKRNEQGSFILIDHSGYGQTDAFYVGCGHYSPFFTCNTWVNSALKSCGQKCCLWTALPQPIFWKYNRQDK